MVNQNRCEVAYNIIDVAGKVTEQTLENLAAIKDVTKVRPIYN